MGVGGGVPLHWPNTNGGGGRVAVKPAWPVRPELQLHVAIHVGLAGIHPQGKKRGGGGGGGGVDCHTWHASISQELYGSIMLILCLQL